MTDQVVDPMGPGSGADAESTAAARAAARTGLTAEAVAGELATEAAAADEEELAAESAAAPIALRAAVLVPIPPDVATDVTTEPGTETKPRRRWPRFLRFLGGFLFGLAAVFALSAGGLYAFDLQYSGRILPGVHVGDVDLSGLTASQASARLADAYGKLSDGELVLTAGDLSSRTPFSDLGRRAAIESMVARALAVGRDGGTFERIVVNAKTAARGVVLDPEVVVDASAVERTVFAFVASAERRPLDARIEARDGTFTLVPAVIGRAIDGSGLLAKALAAVRPVDLPGSVAVETTVTPVTPVTTTEEAEAALVSAKQMVSDIVLADIFQSWTIPAGQVATWISFEATGDGGYRAVATPRGLDAQLAEMATAIQRAPSSASYLFDKSGKIVGASEGKDGRSLDAPGTVAAIAALLSERAGGATVPSVAPAVAIVKPELTTEQVSATAPLMKKISEWTTYFPIYVNNGFGANIWIPAMDLDGYVIAPGALFDFWKAIGPITRERGYRDGGAIINGKTEPQGALAGGICSASTTVFNAALRAGMKMGARRNHYYYISRYPAGLDATVFQSSSGSVQTMSFTNDTPYPILIRAYKIKNGSAGYVKIELYGVPTGRTVTIDPEVVKNIRPASDTTQTTDTLPAGTRQRVESPADGKDVWRTVTVKGANGAVISSITYYSHYSRVDGLMLIGTGT